MEWKTFEIVLQTQRVFFFKLRILFSSKMHTQNKLKLKKACEILIKKSSNIFNTHSTKS